MKNGTRLIGEAVHVQTPEEAVHGFVWNGDKIPPMPNGKWNAELQYVLVRHLIIWHNAASGITHDMVKRASVEPGLVVEPGNVVELEVREGVGKIVRVRYATAKEASCLYKLCERSGLGKVLDAVNAYGGPGSATLDCPGMALDGWQMMSMGPYQGQVWMKPPP